MVYNWYDRQDQPCPITEALRAELPKAHNIEVNEGWIVVYDMRFRTSDRLRHWMSAMYHGEDVDGIQVVLRSTGGGPNEDRPEADIALWLVEP